MLELALVLLALPILWLAAMAIAPGLIRGSWLAGLHAAYRFRVYHAAHLPATGPALIVANHGSYLDWLILWAACPRRVTFVLWEGYYQYPLFRFFLWYVRHHSIRLDNRASRPHAVSAALDAVTAALNAGEAVVVFPEGRLTRNGQMRAFRRGIERALALCTRDVPIVPVSICGTWGSLFSHRGGRILFKWPEGVRRPVSVWFGAPLPKATSVHEVRAAIAEGFADCAIRESHETLLVHRWFVRTWCSWRRIFRPAVVDVATGTERILSGGQLIVAVWCLASWLRVRLGAGAEPVGLWLPTGLGSALGNFALAFLRRTTVNLNYTAGRDAVHNAAGQVGMRFVLTSKRFELKVPLDLPPGVERIYLEDALGAIPKSRKLLRFLVVLLLPGRLLERLLGLHRTKPDDLLTIVFSSGSTGEPKGVMLSHRNIATNAHAFHIGVDLRESDRMLSTLPFFHSFGFTVCLWAPAGIGMTAVYYPDPRSAKEVGELCAKYACTIMLGTATFLRFYLRRCGETDFRSVRLLICGAEKLPMKLADEFEAKFRLRPLEGYGCTETSPVVCACLPDTEAHGVHQIANVLGTVGQPMPGIVAKAFHAETLAPLPPGVDGLLGVKGPNVMAGYFGQPERTQKAIVNGWYLTGDMGRIEPDGFIRITGRLSRFAKIAGEMVPLEKIEEELQDILGMGERMVVVCAVPCEKRGERLILLYLAEVKEKIGAALKELPKRGLPNLWVPDRRDSYELDAFPALGSGKLDLKGVNDLAGELACS